jgi:general secretion pathway protein K
VIRERRNAIRRQRGAAILTAMLTVVLVATLASAMLWQQWRGVEVETAQRGRVQAAWILVGALDWARLILREDARRGGADHLAEPWAVPLAPARLATFLAAQGGQSLVTDGLAGEEEVFFVGGDAGHAGTAERHQSAGRWQSARAHAGCLDAPV